MFDFKRGGTIPGNQDREDPVLVWPAEIAPSEASPHDREGRVAYGACEGPYRPYLCRVINTDDKSNSCSGLSTGGPDAGPRADPGTVLVGHIMFTLCAAILSFAIWAGFGAVIAIAAFGSLMGLEAALYFRPWRANRKESE